MNEKTDAYWNDYYAQKTVQSIPSQFASFVLNEFSGNSTFVDIGCGDGRDSLFFAEFGKNLFGIDGSLEAVSFCRDAAEKRKIPNTHFDVLNLNSAAGCDTFLASDHGIPSNSIVYARFFLHAIDAAAEQNFLKVARSFVGDSGKLCLEFRTPKDEQLVKVTADHYRRYVDPAQFILTAGAHGFKCSYFAEGFGFAKYKADDAYVARIILEAS
ncbi:MAG: class I SAM-dependent methyltransferase [Pseudoruegeria sp.]